MDHETITILAWKSQNEFGVIKAFSSDCEDDAEKELDDYKYVFSVAGEELFLLRTRLVRGLSDG